MTPDRRTLLAIFALTFGLRVLYAAVVGVHVDGGLLTETYFFRSAARVAGGEPWLLSPFTPSAPGYILSLVPILAVFGANVWAAFLFQCGLAGVTAVLLYRIGEKRVGRGVGLLAAIWFALYVHQIHFTCVLVRDTLVVLLWVWLLRVVVSRLARVRDAIWAGVIYTALAHVEPMFLLLFPLLAIGLFFYATDNRLLSVQHTLIFLVTVFVLFLPWTIRNYVVYREPIPVALEASRYTHPITSFFAANGGVDQDLDRAGVRSVRPGAVENAIAFWRVVRFADSPGDPERGIAPEPAWSARHNLVSLVTYGLLLPFALIGAIDGFRRRRRAVIILATAVVAYFLLRVVVGADERGRLPIEPLLILLAFDGVLRLFSRRADTRAREGAPG